MLLCFGLFFELIWLRHYQQNWGPILISYFLHCTVVIANLTHILFWEMQSIFGIQLIMSHQSENSECFGNAFTNLRWQLGLANQNLEKENDCLNGDWRGYYKSFCIWILFSYSFIQNKTPLTQWWSTCFDFLYDCPVVSCNIFWHESDLWMGSLWICLHYHG